LGERLKKTPAEIRAMAETDFIECLAFFQITDRARKNGEE
jgi:hypothetical protein